MTATPIRIQLSFAADNAGAAKAADQIASTLQTALSRNQGLQATLQKIGAGSAIGVGPNGLAAQATALQLRINTLTGAGGSQLNRFFGSIQSGSRQATSAFNRIGDSMIRLSGMFYSLEKLGSIFNRAMISPMVQFTKETIKATEESRKFEYAIAGVAGGLSRARQLNRAIVDVSRNSPQSVEDLRTSAQTLARTPSLAVRLGLGDPRSAAQESERFGSVIGRLGTLDPSQGIKGAQIATINALQGGAGGLTSLRRRFGVSQGMLSSLSGISEDQIKQDPAQALKAIEKFVDTFIPRDAYQRTASLVSSRWQKVQDAAQFALAQVGDSGVFDSLGARLKSLSDQMFDYFGSSDFEREARKVSDGLDRVLGNVARSAERLLNSVTGKPNDISSVAGTVKGVGNLIERIGKLSENLPALAEKFGPAVAALAGKVTDFVDAIIEIANAARDPYAFVNRVASGVRNHLTGQDANVITLNALKRAGIDTTAIGTRAYSPGTNSNHIYREMQNDGAGIPRALGRWAIESIRDANGANVQELRELDFRNLPIEQRIMAQKIYSQAQETGAIDPKLYSQVGSMVMAQQANNGTLPPRADEDATTSLVRKLISREYQSPNFGALLQAAQGGSGPLGELAARDQSPVERFRDVSQIFGKVKIATDDVVSFGALLKRIDDQFIESKSVLEKAIGEGDRQLILGGDDQDLRSGVAELRKQRDRLIESYRGAFDAIAMNKIDAVRDFGTALGDAVSSLPAEARVEIQRAIRDGVTSQAKQFVEIFGEPQDGMKKTFGTGAMSLEQLHQTYSRDLQTQMDAFSGAGRHGDVLSLSPNASFEQIRELKALTPAQGQRQLLNYYQGPATADARELLARAGKEFRDTPDEVSLANLRAAQVEVAELQSKIQELERALDPAALAFEDFASSIRESLEEGVGDALYQLLSQTGSLTDAFRSMAQSILREYASMQAKLLTRSLIGNLAEAGGGPGGAGIGGLGGILGNLFNTSSTPSMAAGMPVNPSVLDIPRYASGGVIDRPSVIMAGEAGSEAVIPLNRGRKIGVELTHRGGIVGAARQNANFVPHAGSSTASVQQAPPVNLTVYHVQNEDQMFARAYNRQKDVVIGDVQRAADKGRLVIRR